MNQTPAYASVSRRFFALCIDSFILALLVGTFLFFNMGKTPAKYQASGDEGRPSLMDKYQFFAYFEPIALEKGVVREAAVRSLIKTFSTDLALGFFVIPMLYFVLLEGFTGRTFGKSAMRIRIGKKDGGKVSFATAFIRYIIKNISALFFMIGYLVALFDKQRQSLHDKAAGTVVLNN